VPADALVPEARLDALADVDRSRLILLEEGHCLRDQALAFCGGASGDMPAGLGATSLATVMQMVANNYGVTLLPQVAAGDDVRDSRVKLLRFAEPQPARTIGLAWRRTSPRRRDFIALGEILTQALGQSESGDTAAKNLRGGRARRRAALPGPSSASAPAIAPPPAFLRPFRVFPPFLFSSVLHFEAPARRCFWVVSALRQLCAQAGYRFR